jgi:acyl-CoA thioesterase I
MTRVAPSPAPFVPRRNIRMMKRLAERLAGSITVVTLLTIGACAPRESGSPGLADRTSAAPAPAPAAAPAAAAAPVSRLPRIVVLGDSLTAGLGLDRRDAYPTLLQQRLKAAGLNYEVVNAGVSGDTSADGLSRLDWALDGDVRVLIVALGGNDGLRGLPVAQLQDNLARIIEPAQARGIRVILAGMDAPPNYGRDYIVSFHKVYPALAAKYHVALVPFLLQNVAGIESLNQRDGIHPTAQGARIVADNVWAVLKPVIEQGRSGS